MTRLKNLTIALLASASALGMHPALAQDATAQVAVTPAVTNVGTINIQGAGQTLGSGYIVQEDGPKDRSTVTQQGIANLSPTVNPFQMVSILPGVNAQSEDAIGIAGGTIRVRGLVASQMGFTINGAPFNDSGTFNVYPNEIIDSENVQQIWVTQGSTDIDAPHVGASGGNIGVVTRAPLDTFNVKAEESIGQLDEQRQYVALDTGWIGNFKGFVSYSHTEADKWRGDGGFDRSHTDGNLVWQILPHSTIGLTWAYNDAVSDYYRDYGGGIAFPAIYNVYTTGLTTLQTFNKIGREADYDTFWGDSSAHPINLYGPNSTASCATNPSPLCRVSNPGYPTIDGGGLNTNVTNSYKLNLNPYRDLVATIPVHIQLADNLRWDTNGYLWDGQGGADFGFTLTEGSYTNGFKVLPAYGNAATATNVILAEETITNKTFRPGFTTKLIYDLDNYTFMVGGWLEHSRLDYRTPFSLVNSNGSACDIWMTKTKDNNCAVQGTSAFGTGAVYSTNYLANSIGESAFVEAQGRFLNDDLKITAGIADRAIVRAVENRNPICADDPSLMYAPGSTILCSSYATSATFLSSSAYQYFNGPTVGAAAAYAAMRKYGENAHGSFKAWLPEFNATYEIDPNQQVFAGISTGFRSPSVGNFAQFTSGNTATASNIMKITDVKSEYATSYELGYRYHNDFFVSSATAYLHDLKDYQASIQIDPADFITGNIGGVKIYGVDMEAGTTPWHGFTFYASAEVQNSKLDSNLAADYAGSSASFTTQYVATKGKQLVDTPNWLVSTNIGYANGGFFASLTPHCTGRRATALLNDEFIPAYCTVDAAAGYHFADVWGAFQDATLQIYASNLTDQKYLGEVYSQGQTNAKNAQAYSASGIPLTGSAATVPGASYTASPGAPLFVGAKLVVDLGH
jgi:iron complex outermembrane receptor protein